MHFIAGVRGNQSGALNGIYVAASLFAHPYGIVGINIEKFVVIERVIRCISRQENNVCVAQIFNSYRGTCYYRKSVSRSRNMFTGSVEKRAYNAVFTRAVVFFKVGIPPEFGLASDCSGPGSSCKVNADISPQVEWPRAVIGHVEHLALSPAGGNDVQEVFLFAATVGEVFGSGSVVKRRLHICYFPTQIGNEFIHACVIYAPTNRDYHCADHNAYRYQGSAVHSGTEILQIIVAAHFSAFSQRRGGNMLQE